MTQLAALRSVLLAAAVALLPVAAPAQGHPEARRVVSLGGSVTEIVVALGAADRLAARDTTSTYPPQITALPDVGYVRALSPEGLLSVGPDLILAEAGAGPAETVAQMQAAAIPFVTIPEGRDAAGVAAKIRAVGEALGTPAAAAELAMRVQGQIAAATARAEGKDRPRVLFILSLQGGRVLASGTGTQADAIIRLAGGENAVAGFEGYKPLTDEAIITAAPEVILMMDRTGDHGASADQLFALPALATTPAAANRRLVQMDGLLLLGFGPRTGEAVDRLSEALHGRDG